MSDGAEPLLADTDCFLLVAAARPNKVVSSLFKAIATVLESETFVIDGEQQLAVFLARTLTCWFAISHVVVSLLLCGDIRTLSIVVVQHKIYHTVFVERKKVVINLLENNSAHVDESQA